MRIEARSWSHGILLSIAIAFAILVSTAGVFARQEKEQPPRDPMLECSLRVRSLEIGVMIYAQKHGGKLPPDLYSALNALAESDGKVGAKDVGEYARTKAVSPAHEGLLKPPGEIDAPWVNDQSSYRYLGNADVSMNDIQEWGDIVIAHLRLDQGHPTEVTPDNPEGQLFTLAFLDGHVQTATRAEAERLIAKSVATLEAVRTGGDAPPDQQALQNLGMILKAIHAYAKAHDDRLPPDLGATLEYVPKDTKATATPKQRGRIFLSPKAQKSGSVPDEPTPEWVNANTGYVYIGIPEIRLGDIPEPYQLVLVHSRMQDAIENVRIDGKKSESVPVGVVGGSARLQHRAYVEWMARESQKTFQWLRTGEGLPEWVNAMRDVRLIGDAIGAYTKANGGALPANLGETLAFLPEKILGVSGPSAIARIYLSPRAEATTQAPQSLTPAWIVENCSYTYHAKPGARLPESMSADWLPLLHGKVEEAYRIFPYWDLEMVEVVPTAPVFGGAHMMQKEWLVQRLADPGTTPKELGGKK